MRKLGVAYGGCQSYVHRGARNDRISLAVRMTASVGPPPRCRRPRKHAASGAITGAIRSFRSLLTPGNPFSVIRRVKTVHLSGNNRAPLGRCRVDELPAEIVRM